MTTKRHLCLVTDRRRLARALGEPQAAGLALLLRQIDGAVRGGIDLVQLRERDLEARDLAALVREAMTLARGTSTRIVVNERADVAIAVGADGVHLRETSVPPARLRRLKPTLLIGKSVHSEAGAIACAGAVDYLIAGTVFRTESKPAGVTLGAGGLAAIVGAAAGIPVLAIGGVTLAALPAIAAAGASGVAAIGVFIPTPGPDLVGAVQKGVEKLRIAFDSASAVP